MTQSSRPPRYTLILRPEAAADVVTLAAHGSDVVAAAAAIVDDLAHGRVVGKELGDRNVSGDLTGLARVKFDIGGQRPQRFRLIYRQLDDTTREIIAIGPREETRHLPLGSQSPRRSTAVPNWRMRRATVPVDDPAAGRV